MNKIEQIAKSDFIVSFGTMLADNKEPIRNSIIESIAKTDAQFVYMHPIDNMDLKLYYTQFVKYEVGSEEGVCALFLDTFVKSSNEQIQNYIDDLDLGYISAESSAGEEEFEEAFENSKNCEFKTLIIGDDLICHERVENLVKMLAIIKKYTDFNLIVLNDELEKKVNECEDLTLEEVAELKSFNGTLVYTLIDEQNDEYLLASQTFANIAKVKDKDEIAFSLNSKEIRKTIKVDEKLNGMVSLLKVAKEDEMPNTYRYKQVKIEKV